MTQESNKAFHEAAGRKPEFIETGLTTADYVYPNYADDPRLVIEVMREREDWDEFADTYFIPAITGDGKRMFYISEHLIMNRTGKLRDLALEWINKQKGKSDGERMDKGDRPPPIST